MYRYVKKTAKYKDRSVLDPDPVPEKKTLCCSWFGLQYRSKPLVYKFR